LKLVRVYQLHLSAAAVMVTHQSTGAHPALLVWRTLGYSVANDQIVAAWETQRLSVVLRRGDRTFPEGCQVPATQLVGLTTAYGAGLRFGEVVRLAASAIDKQPDADPY
jgi:hypothetical protein